MSRAGAELEGTDGELAEQAGSRIKEFQSDRGQPFVLLRVFLSPNQISNPGRVNDLRTMHLFVGCVIFLGKAVAGPPGIPPGRVAARLL